MSRRARRSADAEAKKPRSKRAEKKAKAAESLSIRRRRESDAAKASAVADVANVPDVPTADSVREDAPDPRTPAPVVAAVSASRRADSPRRAGPAPAPSAEEQTAPLPHNEGGPFDEVLPFDEDGPYDEVSSVAALNLNATIVHRPAQAEADMSLDEGWRDLPAPNPREIALPTHTVDSAAEEETGPDSETPAERESEIQADSGDHTPLAIGEGLIIDSEPVTVTELITITEPITGDPVDLDGVGSPEPTDSSQDAVADRSDEEKADQAPIAEGHHDAISDELGNDEAAASTENQDSGIPDSGIPDSGIPDSGIPDSGIPDRGIDAQDSDIPDSNAPDREDSLGDDGVSDNRVSDDDRSDESDDGNTAGSASGDEGDPVAAHRDDLADKDERGGDAEAAVDDAVDAAVVVEDSRVEEPVGSLVPPATEAEPEPDLDAAPESEPQPQPDRTSEPQPEPVAEPAPESDPMAEASSELATETETETETEPEPEPEPEPLVEPSPLLRSSFEPDMTKFGRPETVAEVQERSQVKPIRPLGEEPIFTTADRLRASAFAPLASERVDDQPAPQEDDDAAQRDVASLSGTAPRVSEAFSKPSSDSAGEVSSAPAAEDEAAVADDARRTSQLASTSSTAAAVCAECGEPLSESDIFCGSCGFVKHGVGPSSLIASAPAPNPFRGSVGEELALEPDEVHEPEPVESISGNGAGTTSPSAAAEAPEISDLLPDNGEDRGSAAGDVREPGTLTDAPVDEQISAAKVAHASTPDAASMPAQGLSVLAPPPMSQHRVELPIAPPTPLSSIPAEIEDIEDTRIVERNMSGTRFVLQFSTGDSVIVTGTGLVGRNPIPEPSETFDIVVPITDPSKSVSKTHIEFGQMAGAFWISDRYSGNGSVVREPGGEPRRCEPGKRYRVMRGSRVEIGEQFFIVS
ncbi:FHA domain-containing protein [Salinibacterium sp. M195]|uniref:FHA domain-containing protein n=1 Tax=Salinibacterium sp. M195 TaxID=2583374 RepID=UPI001C625DE2|nr:FHA domain-containing protein [Salinibacterium sp. M195]QYH36534.1 FHA domain-containing protein [Salinibacterium sp. M195]